MQKKKIVILGDINVGKSTMINKYISNGNNSIICSTIGNETYTKNMNGHVTEIWDLSGSPKYQIVTDQMCINADVILLVFDITNENTFMNINKWKDKALKYNNINDITIILIGNKCDLNAQRVIQQNEASEFAINNNMLYYEISMNDIFQIKQIFNTVVYLWSRDVQNNKTESQINSSLSNDEILTPLIQISQTVQTSPTMQTEPNDMHKKLYNELNDKLFNKLQKNLYDDLHEKLHKEKVYNDLQEKVFQETTRNELSKKLHDELSNKMNDDIKIYDELKYKIYDELKDKLYNELKDKLCAELQDSLYKYSENIINHNKSQQNKNIIDQMESTEMPQLYKISYPLKFYNENDEKMFEESIRLYLKKIISNVSLKTQNKTQSLDISMSEVELLGDFIKETIAQTRLYTLTMRKIKQKYCEKK